jgi:hypothetical protein
MCAAEDITDDSLQLWEGPAGAGVLQVGVGEGQQPLPVWRGHGAQGAGEGQAVAAGGVEEVHHLQKVVAKEGHQVMMLTCLLIYKYKQVLYFNMPHKKTKVQACCWCSGGGVGLFALSQSHATCSPGVQTMRGSAGVCIASTIHHSNMADTPAKLIVYTYHGNVLM